MLISAPVHIQSLKHEEEVRLFYLFEIMMLKTQVAREN